MKISEKQRRSASEIVRDLICTVWEADVPDGVELSLAECMELWRELSERERGTAERRGRAAPAPEAADRPASGAAEKAEPETGLRNAAAAAGAAGAAAFKRATHARLRAWREKHGLGSFVPLARETGNGVDEVTISRMHAGERFPIELWRALAAALDRLEGEAAK